MEYCPNGQLFSYLNNTKQKTVLRPAKMMDWAKQIAKGMHYLHNNKIIHRDLKSPNILISYNNVLKISDFGASRNLDEKSTIMSFKGTIAWMAPEVIRNEACSEKVDIYSFGVVLWELLTREIPYKNLDPNSIMWGVGSNKLQLPIPQSAPEGLKLLLQQCWNNKPRNRPSFSQILKHLEIVSTNEILLKMDEEYFKSQISWREEIQEKMNVKQFDVSHIQLYNIEDDLIQKRKEELKHATDIRELYEQKLEKANNLYFELSTVLVQLDQRERELKRREKEFNIHNENIVRPILKREFQDRTKSYLNKNTFNNETNNTTIDTNTASNIDRPQIQTDLKQNAPLNTELSDKVDENKMSEPISNTISNKTLENENITNEDDSAGADINKNQDDPKDSFTEANSIQTKTNILEKLEEKNRKLKVLKRKNIYKYQNKYSLKANVLRSKRSAGRGVHRSDSNKTHSDRDE